MNFEKEAEESSVDNVTTMRRGGASFNVIEHDRGREEVNNPSFSVMSFVDELEGLFN